MRYFHMVCTIRDELAASSNWCHIVICADYVLPLGREIIQWRCNSRPTLPDSEMLQGVGLRYCHIVICLLCPWARDDPEMHWWSDLAHD